MTEDFLHHIWQNQAFNHNNLTTTNGEEVTILKPGIHNHLSGPDFHEALIQIGDTKWAGSVEIHLSSSDWYHHNHEEDSAYHNVILHVVFDHDIVADGFKQIPLLELKGRISRQQLNRYEELSGSDQKIPCSSLIENVDEFVWQNWIERCAVERLESKSEFIQQLDNKFKGDQKRLLLVLLFRAFGFKWNADPMEELANRIPIKEIEKKNLNQFQLEALMLGQAGFLTASEKSPYRDELKKEYSFLKSKFGLSEMKLGAWKTGGVRPANSPHLRLAQLSSVMTNWNVFNQLFNEVKAKELIELLRSKPLEYWEEHYRLGRKSKGKVHYQLSYNGACNIITNSVVPFLYFIGNKWANYESVEKAINLLEQLPAEKNGVINSWKSLSLKIKNGLQSQGALHLSKNYCNFKLCLECDIGKSILK